MIDRTNLKLEKNFKITFIIGLIFLFVSLFFNWYYFQVQDRYGNIIASWYYNLFINWYSDLNHIENSNYSLKPDNLLDTPIVNIVFIIIILFSFYIVLFKDINSSTDYARLQKYSYINFSLLIISGFYLFFFIVYYLYSNNLYFPFLIFIDIDLNLTYYYCIGEGYLLQSIGFLMVFPYSLFYYKTLKNFEIEENTPEKVIENYIDQTNIKLDLQKLINQEKNKIRFESI